MSRPRKPYLQTLDNVLADAPEIDAVMVRQAIPELSAATVLRRLREMESAGKLRIVSGPGIRPIRFAKV